MIYKRVKYFFLLVIFMSFLHALKLLEIYFLTSKKDFKDNLPLYPEALKNYYYYHVPFVIHFPFIIILSPYFWYIVITSDEVLNIFYIYYIIPFLIYIFFIIDSILFDKLQFYSIPPTLNLINPYFSLRTAIIMTSSLIFFFLHPYFGWFFLIMSIIYSKIYALILWRDALKKRMLILLAESIILYTIFIVLIVIVLFINNILQSYKMLKQFEIL